MFSLHERCSLNGNLCSLRSVCRGGFAVRGTAAPHEVSVVEVETRCARSAPIAQPQSGLPAEFSAFYPFLFACVLTIFSSCFGPEFPSLNMNRHPSFPVQFPCPHPQIIFHVFLSPCVGSLDSGQFNLPTFLPFIQAVPRQEVSFFLMLPCIHCCFPAQHWRHGIITSCVTGNGAVFKK